MPTLIDKQNVEKQNAEPTLSIQIHRLIRASRERVFEAWTRPEFLQQWFGPGEMIAPHAEVDLREGGAYLVQMEGVGACTNEQGERLPSRTAVATGTYTRIVPNQLLAFTWRGDWSPEEDTLVTLEFRDAEGGTEVILTHERFATESSMEGHRKGWESSLAKLARVLES